ncbi:MAG: phosphoribosylamine--glycine ligase [Pseudobacteriovorax sp.]|nr:phosphoribosylamine--glycine ligase [Pseudobacteriovorax sp.]
MKVLVIGSGAREHALAWKLTKSTSVETVLAWPSSVAMATTVKTLPTSATNVFECVDSALEEGVDLIVVGPEQPLAEGIGDYCQKKKIPVFGPNQNGAKLESSKDFAKQMMSLAGIPTASHKTVTSFDDCLSVAKQMLRETGGTVIKASGLAGGKGVFVCKSEEDIEKGISRLKDSMKEAASTIVVEEILEGRECSFFCMVGQGQAVPMGFAVDFKRLQDGDLGPNTGGMGCYTPVPWLPQNADAMTMQLVVDPLLQTLKDQGISYTGFLYVGLMWGEKGPQVVEFNVRLGDPEAQVLAVQDSSDWGVSMAKCAGLSVPDAGSGDDGGSQKALAVVLAGEGYPFEKPEADVPFLSDSLFANSSDEVFAFGASLKSRDQKIVPGAGRVLTVVAKGDSYESAYERAYEKVSEVTKDWPKVQFRKDIGKRLIP